MRVQYFFADKHAETDRWSAREWAITCKREQERTRPNMEWHCTAATKTVHLVSFFERIRNIRKCCIFCWQYEKAFLTDRIHSFAHTSVIPLTSFQLKIKLNLPIFESSKSVPSKCNLCIWCHSSIMLNHIYDQYARCNKYINRLFAARAKRSPACPFTFLQKFSSACKHVFGRIDIHNGYFFTPFR